MTSPVEKVIAALGKLSGEPTENALHDIVNRAFLPAEPTTAGTIIILAEHVDRLEGNWIPEPPYTVYWFTPGNPMDSEANGFARWHDSTDGAYRTWEWLCERDGQRRIFQPVGARS